MADGLARAPSTLSFRAHGFLVLSLAHRLVASHSSRTGGSVRSGRVMIKQAYVIALMSVIIPSTYSDWFGKARNGAKLKFDARKRVGDGSTKSGGSIIKQECTILIIERGRVRGKRVDPYSSFCAHGFLVRRK